MPKLDYVMRKETIDITKKDFFSIDEKQRRALRSGAVKSLAQGLKAGKHFNSPFVVNYALGQRKLIDGNHRWEAVLSVLANDSDFRIEVWYAEYRDVSLSDERDVFSLWNIGTKQSADDFLKIYWETIPKGKEMLEKIPASIYNSKSKIKVKTIVGNHIDAKKRKKFAGGYSAGSVKTVKDFQDIRSEDIVVMSGYIKDMAQIFGSYNKDVIFWKGTPQAAFYRIWYDNRSLPQDTFIKAFKKVFLGNSILMWEQYGKSGGIEASKMFYELAIKQLKETKGLGVYSFVSDVEATVK